MGQSVFVGMPVVFHCDSGDTDKPALVSYVHEKAEDEEYPMVRLIVFCPETGISSIKHYVAYCSNAFSGDTSDDSWHFVGDVSQS